MMSAITNCHFMMVRCIFATKVSQIKQKNRHVCARGGALFIQKPTLCWPDGQALFQRMDIPEFFRLFLLFLHQKEFVCISLLLDFATLRSDGSFPCSGRVGVLAKW